MNAKRLPALFGAFVLAFSVVLGRCYVTADNQTYAAAAEGQRITNLPLEGERGGFYFSKQYADCGQKIVEMREENGSSGLGILFREGARQLCAAVPSGSTRRPEPAVHPPQRGRAVFDSGIGRFEQHRGVYLCGSKTLFENAHCVSSFGLSERRRRRRGRAGIGL